MFVKCSARLCDNKGRLCKGMGRFHQAYRRSDVGTCALGRLPFTQRSFTFKRFRHALPHRSHVCRRL